MKWFKGILLSLLLLLLLAASALYFYLKSTAPSYSGEVTINGLKEPVQVRYDKYGVPHIRAGNHIDAYRALGFVHAQDRLFQMEMMRRLTKGQLSEVVGIKALDLDKAMLTLQLAESGKAAAAYHFARIDADWKRDALAYVDGINDFINHDKLPIEFKLMGFKPRPFTIEDVYDILTFMSYSFTSAIREEPVAEYIASKLGDDYLKDFRIDSASVNGLFDAQHDFDFLQSIWMARNAVDRRLPVAPWTGSNSWAISSKLSRSGKPLLANDTHIGYKQPAIWYEADLAYPGYHFYEYHLAGVPFAIIGHNEDMGWGLTIFPFDNMDLYAEAIDKQRPDSYFNGKNYVPFQHKKYTIKVKDSHDEEFDLRFSTHGPILNDAYPGIHKNYSHKAIAAWWSGHHLKTRMLEATYHMARSKSLDNFERYLPLIDIVGLNVIYADNQDNIAWYACGKIPLRPKNMNSRLIINGSDTTMQVTDFYDFSHNPRSVNPECGYLVTANNPPHRVNGVLYPGYYAPGLRAQRIEELLKKDESWDVDKMKTIQNDLFSRRDTELVALLAQCLSPQDRREKYFKILVAWDGRYDVNSQGATLFTKWLYFTLYKAMHDEMGEEFSSLAGLYLLRSNIEKLFYNESSPWWDSRNTPEVESRNDILRQAWQATLDYYQKHPQDLAWGKHHFLLHKHPLGAIKPLDKIFNVGPFPKSGSNEVVDKEAFAYTQTDSLFALSGPAMRMLIDFAEPNSALGVLPTGQSGNVMSPFYNDQAPLFNSGTYRPQWLEVPEKAVYKILILNPVSE